MTDGIGVPNSKGGDAEGVVLDPIFKFDSKTCPMCMMHGGKDRFSPMSSTDLGVPLGQATAQVASRSNPPYWTMMVIPTDLP